MGDEARLLQEILVTGDRDLTKEVALVAGKSRAWVSEQYYKNINSSIHCIKAAWLVTGDPRLKKLLEPDGWELRKVVAAASTKGVEQEALDLIVSVSEFVKTYRAAYADDRLTPQEKVALLTSVKDVEIELAELKSAVGGEMDETGDSNRLMNTAA